MIFVDTHCDTSGVCLDRRHSFYSNPCAVNIEKARAAGNWLQVFAAFAHGRVCRGREIVRAMDILDKAIQECELNADTISLCTSYADIMEAFSNGKMAAMLSLEGCEGLQGSLAMLRTYYRIGVRMASFTWNFRNEYADGITEAESGGGITARGRELVAEMNRLGMVIDVSHISDAGFWDIIRYSKAPVIASHSNSRHVCPHPRNLDDEQLKAIADKGGAVGINFWAPMLKPDGVPEIDDMVAHIEHIVNVAGEDAVGMGADYDGMDELPNGIQGIQDTHKLLEALERRGHSEQFIEKFAGGNMLRVLREVIG